MTDSIVPIGTSKTEYSNVPIGTSNPGCIVILVDQSWSMSEPFGNDGNKAERAALAVNRVLEELVLACRSGEEIRDRCHVTVIGYGAQVNSIVNGMISEVPAALIRVEKIKKHIPDGAGGTIEIDSEMPIWIEPKSDNGTPMHEAFERAAEVVEGWVSDKPNTFPPVVINVTDAEASDLDLTTDAARKIMNLHTMDGKALVFNIHIADNKREIIFPNDKTQLADNVFAKFLFDISSTLPQPLVEAAKNSGFSPGPGAKCSGYNIDESLMIRLLQFGSLGVTQVRALPPPTD